MPKVSIIIPTYNREKFIIETIQSVLNQTVKDLEIIIVDDGSTDNTKDIVKKLIEKDNRIKYFYQENCGRPAVPRNFGFKNSIGEYVAFLDSDDIWFPEKVEEQIKLFEKDKNGKLGFVDCGHIIIDENGTEMKKHYNFHSYRGYIFQEFLRDNLILTPGSILIKRSVLNKLGLFDERFKFMDDWDMWLKISKYYNFDSVDENLFKYRVHKNSVTVGLPRKNKQQEVLYIFEKNESDYYKYFPKKIKEAYIFYCWSGDIKKGRKLISMAIHLNPYNYKNYFHYIISLFGNNFYGFSLSIVEFVLKFKNLVLNNKPIEENGLRSKIFKDVLNIKI